VWNAVCSTPWAIIPEKLALIIEVVRVHAAGERDRELEQSYAMLAAARSGSRRAGSIAVLPLYGVVAQRMDLMSASSGGCSTEQFAQSFRQAMADPSVAQVVIDIDSPGGSVYGVAELADEIYNARKAKPIAAIANSLAASAAYWIGSAAGELSCTPSGEVGSVGVFASHFDESRMIEALGVTPTLISAGKFKTEGNPYQPLDQEALGAIQKRVDDYYGMFIKGVARGRGASLAAVRDGFGQGRVVGAADALKLGMIDHVETLDQMLARLGGGSLQSSIGARAECESEIETARARLRLRSAKASGRGATI
jgi:signal peptide peptidase SppA